MVSVVAMDSACAQSISGMVNGALARPRTKSGIGKDRTETAHSSCRCGCRVRAALGKCVRRCCKPAVVGQAGVDARQHFGHSWAWSLRTALVSYKVNTGFLFCRGSFTEPPLSPVMSARGFADVPAVSDYRHRPDAQASAQGAGHISSYSAMRPDLCKFSKIFLTQAYAARCSFYAA